MIFDLLNTLTTFSLDLIDRFGYFGIFLISFLENVFTPLPSEAVMPFAGILISQNRMDLLAVLVAAVIGNVAGAYVFYGLGFWLGSDRIRRWIHTHGKYIFITDKDLDRAEKWFARYEDYAVLICRVVPLVRSFISIPAGYVKMPILKFTVLTAIGTTVWSTLLVYIGIVFGENYESIIPIFKKLDVVFFVLMIVCIAYFIYHKNRPSTQPPKTKDP